MLNAQEIELVKSVIPVVAALLGSSVTLLGLYLTKRSDAKKDRRQILRDRGEELYVLNENWVNGMNGYFLGRLSVMQGKITYNQALDLELAEGHRKNSDFSRFEMLIDVYFPSTRPAYDQVTATRDALNAIASQHKRAYEVGDIDGKSFCKPLREALQTLDENGNLMKAAITKQLRSI